MKVGVGDAQNLACVQIDPNDVRNATAESALRAACFQCVLVNHLELGYLPALAAWSIL
jgi:hypothetical protein